MGILRASRLFLAFMVAMIMACNTQTSEHNIVGKWAYAEWSLGEQQVDLMNMGEPTIEFEKDGAYILRAGFQENHETWQLKGDTLTLVYKDGNNQSLVIDKHTADTLVLTGKAGELDSKLVLVKVK